MAGKSQYRSDSAGDVQRDVGIQWLVSHSIGQIVLGMYSGMWHTMAGMLQYRSDSAGDVERDVGIQWLVCYSIGQIVLGMYSGCGHKMAGKMKRNEMNRALGHFCAHRACRLNWARITS